MANSCPYGYYLGDDGLCHYSGWNSWGRWIVAAIFFLFAALLLLVWLRRFRFSRRARQQQQQLGGGGPAPTPLHTIPPQYAYAPQYNSNSPYGAQYPPPPPPPFYATKPGVEEGVATPANVYPRNPVNDGYEPPSGPPPSGKKF